MKKYSVAIDGPSGAGKSTISSTVARNLGFLYVDTGALYRVIGLSFLRSGGLDLSDIDVSLAYIDGVQRMFLCGEDVTESIRLHEVSRAASDCSALPEVRSFLLERQRSLARENSVIMDGRDIGTVVLPGADVKIFLTAAPEDRARRRYEELLARGSKASFDEILRDVTARDKNDSTRAIAPLRPAEGAVLLDTTGNSFEKSARLVEGVIRERLGL